MRRFFLTLLALTCLAFPALADDVLSVDASVAKSITMDESYLCVTCPLDGNQQVMLTVTDAKGALYYQRDFGLNADSFRSEDVYLQLSGSGTTYSVSLQAGETIYAFTVNRVTPRLTGNAACSVGYPLSKLSGTGGWQSATILDVAALEGSSLTVDMHASDAYTLGTVTFSISGGKLKVSADIASGLDATIDGATVYVATDALQAQNLGGRHFDGLTARLGDRVDLGGTPYAAVWVKLTVSFDPTGVPGSPTVQLKGQDELWLNMQQSTPSEAVG